MEAEAFGNGGGSSSVYRSRVAAAARAIAAAASASALPPAAAQAAATGAAVEKCSGIAAIGVAAEPQSVDLGQPTVLPPNGQNGDVKPAAALAADGAGILAQFEELQGRLARDDAAAAVVSLQRLGSTAVTAALLAETGADQRCGVDT
jgi:hypothetical protein